jgi:hypothetical protein
MTGGTRVLSSRLRRDLGLSKKVSEILATRRVSEIAKIEQTIHGIVDCLLLYRRSIFYGFDDYKVLKRMIRKIFHVGTFNVAEVIGFWKDFTSETFLRLTESKTEEKPKRSFRNFFFELEEILALPESPLTKDDLRDLGHLCNSRQLPCGGPREEQKALKALELINTTRFETDRKTLADLREGARIIGKRCRKAGSGPIRRAHLSMAASGSLYYSVKEGGRAQEMISAITPTLSHIPTEDKEIVYPLGVLTDKKGLQRWRTWCRETPFLAEPERGFGDPSIETIGGEVDLIKLGFDEAIGDQLLACALLEEQQAWSEEIPLRVLTVREPGNKARIVTTGPWWAYAIQQPLAHVTRGYLASYPPAEAGMSKTENAWQFLRTIQQRRSSYKDDFACLSSDLKSATDSIPQDVAKALLSGFLAGLGFYSPLGEICIEMMGKPRLCMSEKTDSIWSSVRGVFMGEPLAKTLLTLAVCSAEEVAIRKYLGYDFLKPVQATWRSFATAGDDHIAVGPVPYLKEITKQLLAGGMIISPDKHAYSTVAVRYCERILDVRQYRNTDWTMEELNSVSSSYLASPLIDTVKLRLISPCSKSNEGFNDRNTAVGKGKSLGSYLDWISTTGADPKWVTMVKERFFTRMGSLMPSRSSGVYWHLLLPQCLGGLGMATIQDYPDLVAKLPAPSKTALKEYVQGTLSTEDAKRFRGFTSNISYRGYALNEGSLLYRAKELIVPMALGFAEKISLDEACKKLGLEEDLTLKQKFTRLRSKNFLRGHDVEDIIMRPYLFSELLGGKEKPTVFNTESFIRRYQKLWDLTYRGDVSITTDDILKAFEKDKALPELYHFPEEDIFVRGEVKTGTVLEEVMTGLPTLSISWKKVGELVPPEGGSAETYPFGDYV